MERNCVEKKLDSAKHVTDGTPGRGGEQAISGDSDSGSSPPPETLSWKAEAGARKAEIGHTWRLVSREEGSLLTCHRERLADAEVGHRKTGHKVAESAVCACALSAAFLTPAPTSTSSRKPAALRSTGSPEKAPQPRTQEPNRAAVAAATPQTTLAPLRRQPLSSLT